MPMRNISIHLLWSYPPSHFFFSSHVCLLIHPKDNYDGARKTHSQPTRSIRTLKGDICITMKNTTRIHA